jgi:succinate dehydrogenase / fumarate reductase, membrane anchor subunit
MSLRSDIGRVRGLGSAKSGTHHWWAQRVSAIGLVLLGLWLLASLASGVAGSYEAVIGWVRQPLVSVLLLLTVATVFYHLRLGLQVVIEDYVHAPANKLAASIALNFLSIAGGVAGLFAVLKIAFGA